MSADIYMVCAIALWMWMYSKYDMLLIAIEMAIHGEKNFQDMDVEKAAKGLMLFAALLWPVTIFVLVMARNDN